MQLLRPMLAATLLAAVTAACSSPTTSPSSPSSANSGASATTTQAAAPKSKTAEEVTKALAQKIPTVKLTRTYTAADDPNHKLGRPNGYTGKTAFSDSRVPAADASGHDPEAVEWGGSVEVFPEAEGAQARMQFIQGVSKSLNGLTAEYDYVSGGTLVRVSNLLTPDQAKSYEIALQAVVG